MAQSATTETGQAAPQRAPQPRLEAVEPGNVVRCSNAATGWTWFYEPIGKGYVWLSHELFDYESETRPWTSAAMVIGGADVDAAIVPRECLEKRRRDVGGDV